MFSRAVDPAPHAPAALPRPTDLPGTRVPFHAGHQHAELCRPVAPSQPAPPANPEALTRPATTARRSRFGLGLALGALAALLSSAANPTPAAAQCSATWATDFGNPGVNLQAVNTITPLATGDLLIAGNFTNINNIFAVNVARFNPATGAFSAAGNGPGGTIFAAARVPAGLPNEGDVIVGGTFTSVAGAAAGNLARYSPATNTWTPIPTGVNGQVRGLAIVPAGLPNAGDIYITGAFVAAGPFTDAFFVARYIPTTNTWAKLGPAALAGLGNTANTVTVVPAGLPGAGDVIIGGLFDQVRTDLPNTARIVRYRPSTNAWLAAGTGMPNADIRALTVVPASVSATGEVIVGGAFSAAGGIPASNIARFDLSTNAWSTLGAGFSAAVWDLEFDSAGTLFAAGAFSTAGSDTAARGVARFNRQTSAWSAIGATGPLAGGGTFVNAIAPQPSGDLYAVGDFIAIGSTPALRLARYFAGSGGPVISVQPVDRVACPGTAVSFSLTAAAPLPIRYQWRFNGVNIDPAVNPSATTATLTIPSAAPANAGTYDCLLTAGCTITSAARTLTLSAAPVITQQPASQFTCPGGTANLQVVASGTAPLSFQWRRNGVNIPGATTSNLAIPNFQAANAGDYSCVVTNACGSATSASRSVTLRDAVAITQQPAPLSVCPNSPATFSVTATGTFPLTYQWRRNGANIPGATAATYSIPAAQAANQGTYDCVVTNPCGSLTSSAAALTIGSAPAITQQPASLTICPGTPATFSVTASGSGPFTYRWRLDGINLNNSTAISGVTTATLTLNPTTVSLAGSYDCVITSACGSITSSTATLAFRTNISITQQPAPTTVCPGAPATFSIAATGTGPLTYRWRRNGANLSDGSGVTGSASPTLTIASASAALTGTYDCVITGPCASLVSASAALTVTQNPLITQQPTSATACIGGQATFTISATGPGNLTYRWFRNGNPIAPAPNLSGQNTATLTINLVTADDLNAAFTATVTGPCTTVTSTPANLLPGACACSPADIVAIGGITPPDGILTGDDFNAFVAAFAASQPMADIVAIGGITPPDGLITGDDFNAFIAAFAAGCP